MNLSLTSNLLTGSEETANQLDESGSIAENNETDYEQFYQNAQFITGLICYPILCIIGLTGNALTLIVLRKPKMATPTNTYLSALAVADSIKLLNDALYFVDLILYQTHPEHGNRMRLFMYPISHYIFNEAVCVTSWLTVCVAVERYISICHPTRSKTYCTIHKARILSIIVFISMSLLSIPSAFRYTKVTCTDSLTNETYQDIGLSSLGRNKTFMNVYIWVQNLLRSVIPLFVLILLNACIIHALRKERIKGKAISARNRITFMLLMVIVVFLLCITPDAIMSTFFGFGYVEADYLVKGIREYTDMLLAVNSAVNFIIYCAFSKVFRDTFMEIFCSRIYTRSYPACKPQRLLQSEITDRRGKRSIDNQNLQVFSSVVVNNCDASPFSEDPKEHTNL